MYHGKPMEKCIVCGQKIFRSTNPGRIEIRRAKNCVTCSKLCSRIYTRIRRYLYYKIKRNVINEFNNK